MASASGKTGARGQDAQADRGQISCLHRRYFLYLITSCFQPAYRTRQGPESQGPRPQYSSLKVS